MGTSCNDFVQIKRTKDHPHAYGDKSVDINGNRPEIGSSPRVWGQAENKPTIGACCRIIPTRMGTSCRNGQRVYQSKDHPHACGDKRDIHHPNLQAVGSSPRVWGQESLARLLGVIAWIIPTRVGTSIGRRCSG